MGVRSTIVSFVKKFDAKNDSTKAGINWIATAGFFGDQLASIPQNENELVEFAADKSKFYRGLLPYLHTADNRDNFIKLDAYLANYDQYKEAIRIRTRAKERPQDAELMYGIQRTVKGYKAILIEEAKILLSITFPKIKQETIMMQVPVLAQLGGGNYQLPFGQDTGVPSRMIQNNQNPET